MNQQIEEMLTALRTFDLPVFEDDLAEDEEEQFKKDGHHFFVYETGDIVRNDDRKSLEQEIVVFYYSENRDDLDERTVDIITTLPSTKLFRLERTQKQRLRRKDTDDYVDRILFFYSRTIVIPGCVFV